MTLINLPKALALIVLVITYILSSLQYKFLHYGPVLDFIVDSAFMISALTLYWDWGTKEKKDDH